MPLHRLTHVTIGVPNVAETSRYYTDFGLTPLGDGRFASADGGEQLRIVHAPRRRLVELGIGADDPDDLAAAADRLSRQGFAYTAEVAQAEGAQVVATEPTTGANVILAEAPRLRQRPEVAEQSNGPGRADRTGERAPAVLRDEAVRPSRLGHVVIGSTDIETIRRFFIDAVGFAVSDEMEGKAAFLRCSTDHHNVMVQSAPVPFLHHTSWQVRDVDEIGRGATAMLDGDPARHVWGMGRHLVGSNYFWYLRDPAGNFSEYYSDLDVILEDQLWQPQVWEGRAAYAAWGPPTPPSFIKPDDLTELMAGLHPAR
jgi:catechol 2,3-dioxygenase-like lactoylglutathione lyase family enzyme